MRREFDKKKLKPPKLWNFIGSQVSTQKLTLSAQTCNALHVLLLGMKDLGWMSSEPQAELINDIIRGNPILFIVANVIVETLGVQAAQVFS